MSDRRTLLELLLSQTVLPQLDTPTGIFVNGTIISFTEIVNATSYEVFADGTSIGTYQGASVMAMISIELAILPGWSGLSIGSHTITLKAKAEGYRDSLESQGVSVTKQAEDNSGIFDASNNKLQSWTQTGMVPDVDYSGRSIEDEGMLNSWLFNRGASIAGEISSIVLPNNITKVGAYWGSQTRMNGLDSLSRPVSIIIPDNVSSIGQNAFYYTFVNTNSTISIPNSINNLGTFAFVVVAGMSKTCNVIYRGTKSQLALIDSQIRNAIGNGSVGYNGTYTFHCTDGDVVYTMSCFLAGTKITLADGTTKNIEDIEYSDILRVWDFDTGDYGNAPICWLTRKPLYSDHYYKLTFSDGTILKTTGVNSNHKIYNVDERFFKGVDKTEIGDRIYSENGIVTVTNKEYFEEDVEYYNIITSQKINCFANGILASDRMGNLYPIDENMKYIKNDRPIRPYSEFEAVGIEKYWYDNLRLGESVDSVETLEAYVQKCLCQMRPIN